MAERLGSDTCDGMPYSCALRSCRPSGEVGFGLTTSWRQQRRECASASGEETATTSRSSALSLLEVALIPKSLIHGQPFRLPGSHFLGLEVERGGPEDEREAGLQDGVLLTPSDEREGIQDAVPELFVGADRPVGSLGLGRVSLRPPILINPPDEHCVIPHAADW